MAEMKGHQHRRQRQDAISLTPDVDGTGSDSLLDSIISLNAFLRKGSSDVWVGALPFSSPMT